MRENGASQDLFARWRRELDERDLDPKTRSRYWQCSEAFRAWLRGRPANPSEAKTFLAHLREKDYRPASVALYYHALRQLLDFAGQPLKLKIRKERRLARYYDPADIEAIIAEAERGLARQTPAIRRRNAAIITVLAFTGLRRSELLNLRVDDVDLEARRLTVRQGKGRKDRVIPLPQRAVVAFMDLMRSKGAQERVVKLRERKLYGIVRRSAEAAGLAGVHPHTMRHAYATRLVEKGANLRAVQELLGHTDISTTAIYLDVTAKHLETAVQLLDEGPARYSGEMPSDVIAPSRP